MKATKAEIIDRTSQNSALNKTQVKRILNSVLENIKVLLTEYDVIELRGFGTFRTRELRARDNARNPKTGERVSIGHRRAVFFRPGKEMRQIVNKSRHKNSNKE